MSSPRARSAGNRDGNKRMRVRVNLGSTPKIQDQITALYRQLGQLAARIAEGERQRAEETANADVRIAEDQQY